MNNNRINKMFQPFPTPLELLYKKLKQLNMNKDNSSTEAHYDYNNPIDASQIEILSQIFTWQPNEGNRRTEFRYEGETFLYCFNSTPTCGFASIFKKDIDGDLKQIYSTSNDRICTSLGRFLQYSIMKNLLCKAKY